MNMNYFTFDEPISLFANDIMFYFHFCHISNSYRWSHVERRIPLNLVLKIAYTYGIHVR